MNKVIEVNNLIPGFFKDDFGSERDAERILNLVNAHIEKVGALPLISLKRDALRSDKELSLMHQLKADSFKHQFGVSIDLKTKNNKITLIFSNKDNVNLSILSANIEIENQEIEHLGEERELEILDVDVYNADIFENGKKINSGNADFSAVYEELFSTQFYSAEDIHDRLETMDGFEAVNKENLNSFYLMDKIEKDESLRLKLEVSVSKSNDYSYTKQKEKNSENNAVFSI